MTYLHHIAIQVSDIKTSVNFYQTMFNAEVEYQDETWALLNVGSRTKLALVLENEHPKHICFVTPLVKVYKGTLKEHRDGTKYKYIEDPSGNVIEMLLEED